jgi:hypothetical protein
MSQIVEVQAPLAESSRSHGSRPLLLEVASAQRRALGPGEDQPAGIITHELGQVLADVIDECGRYAYTNMDRSIVALVYRCRPGHVHARETSESSAVGWVDTAEVPALMAPAYAVRVLDALSDGPASGAHDGEPLVATRGQQQQWSPAGGQLHTASSPAGEGCLIALLS